MRLKNAARYFNDTQALDAYTGDEAFKCNFTSFDDHSSSGATARRRVLNLPEGIEIPVRSCISLFNEVWLVGTGSPDSFAGEIVRISYGMKKATDLARFGAPGATLANSSGLTLAYIQKLYFKDTVNTVTESATDITWNVFISPHEDIRAGHFIVTSDLVLRVRKTYLPVEGLRVAECDEMSDAPVQTAVFIANGTYNSATDSYATITTTVQVYVVDYNRLYHLHTPSDAPYLPGDLAVLVAKTSLTPIVGSEFSMLGTKWRVLTVQSELDSWLLHVRVG